MPGTVLSARTSSLLSFPQPNEVHYNPYFIDMKIEFREVKSLAQGRTASKRQSSGSSLALPAFIPTLTCASITSNM